MKSCKPSDLVPVAKTRLSQQTVRNSRRSCDASLVVKLGLVFG